MAESRHGGSSGSGYRFASGGSGSGGRKNDRNDWVSWIVMAAFWATGLWPLAIIMLIRNLSRMGKNQRKKVAVETGNVIQDVLRGVRNTVSGVRSTIRGEPFRPEERGAEPAEGVDEEIIDVDFDYVDGSGPAGTKGRRRGESGARGGDSASGKGGGERGLILGLTIGGAAGAILFGLGALVTLGEAILYGTLAAELGGIVLLALLCLGGVGALLAGTAKKRRRDRYLTYLAYIGDNQEVDLAHMAVSFDVPARRLCRDLRNMLADGILPVGYLDLAAGRLYLTDKGYTAPDSEGEEGNMTEEEERRILREIRQVNDEIPDPVMSAKIQRIEEITGKILAYRKAHPEKAGQLRSFLNYYMPTTLKILRAYARLDAQGIEGENITATKARIEGMMDQVVLGFERQLDKLFQDEAMDIGSDVQVLENMLKKDGLSGDGGTTMTL